MTASSVVTVEQFRFGDGSVFDAVPVAYHAWGRLNAAGDNCVVVCHALTGNTDVADWWEELLGSGRAFDPAQDFVICLNVIGSPYGTLSPLTVNPHSGQAFGPDFPVPTIRDTVALHARALEQLGVRRIRLVAGGSMGGMQVLEWAFAGLPVAGLVPIACGGRHSAWCIAWSETQRQAIFADPNWLGGRYAAAQRPDLGLAIARMIAMNTYRSQSSFEARFGRAVDAGSATSDFMMKGYLEYQGARLVERFDANCYVCLTHSMDSHDLAADRGDYGEVLGRIVVPTLVVGIDSDILYPLAEQQELAAGIPQAELAVLEAHHGHDSFLIERERLNSLLVDWRRRVLI